MLVSVARGVRAEQGVARTLRRLLRTLPHHYVINGVPLQRGDIDHIVVGPTGVFVIETKAYQGTVDVTPDELTIGRACDRESLRRVRRTAAVVRQRLHMAGLDVPWVQPLLCLPHADLERPHWAGNVLVTRREHLGFFVRHWFGHRLSTRDAARIHAVLRLSSHRAAA